MELVRGLGFNCFVREAVRDLTQTGHYESYLIYYCQFVYNFIEGGLPSSVRVFAAPNTKYAIDWPHEVILYIIFSLISNNFQQSLFARSDPAQECDGMFSIGDFPFPVMLPEPIISASNKRIYYAHSFEDYDPTA